MRAAEAELVAALRIPGPLAAARLDGYLDRCSHRALAALARREGVAGLLYRDVRRGDLDGRVEARVLDELQDGYARTAAANARRAAALREVFARPELQDIKIVVLKGMALLDDIYRDWGLRPMTDIDVWVDDEGNPPLRDALLDLGYAPQPFYPDTFRRGAVSIDVHTSLLGSERIAARRRILADGESRPFSRARRFHVGGRGAWRLDPQDTVLFACLHLLKHNACRLLWLLEVDALVSTWNAHDRTVLARRAEGAGQERALELVAFLARDLLVGPGRNDGAPDRATLDGDAGERPGGGLAALANDTGLSPIARRALSRRRVKGRLPVWGPLVFFNAGGSAGERAAAAFETLFPRPAILRQIFRDRDSPLASLYFRRFWQLLEMIVRR